MAEQFCGFKDKMHLAAGFFWGASLGALDGRWVSQKSLNLMEHKRQPPNFMVIKMRHFLKMRFKKERENWWVKIAKGMEVTAASEDSQRLLSFTCDTGGRRLSVSKIVCD